MSLNLERVEIKKFDFENNMISGESLSLQVQTSYSLDISDEKNRCVGSLELQITTQKESESSLSLRIIIQGFFVSTGKLNDEELAGRKTHSMLFPHAQAAIRTITAITGIPALQVPYYPLQGKAEQHEK